MKKLILTATFATCIAPLSAHAQEDSATVNRIEPYVAVMGGYNDFDDPQTENLPDGIPGDYSGTMVEGIAGVNYNVGRLVLGVEGNVAKGIEGDIDWEYGAAGRAGVKLGKDSMFFGKVGYEWTNFAALGPDSKDYDGMTYGMGVELSAADMGMSANRSNLRFRGQVDTRGNFHSLRPMAGIVLKY
tara:strand:+ start:14960 stop:15517 length:558 start_codon:yes stop_codon:yes gene_type:complete